jgi:hypothetical protein
MRLDSRLRIALPVIAALLLAITASTAGAFSLRNPQVVFNGASLQGYLNGVGEGINVYTDQVDAQVWSTTVSGNSTFTLMIEYAGNAGANAIGIYNIADPNPVPALFQVFPAAATAGWFATAHFGDAGSLVVSLFDNNAAYQGQAAYGGVDKNNFGFYLQGPGGLFFSDDLRNGGNPQMLTYAGTGINFGTWWECIEDLPWTTGDRDFEDAVLVIESVSATPTDDMTWGQLKKLYRK